MVDVKLGNLTFEGVDSVKLDTTDGGSVVFTLEGSGGGGADTGIVGYVYDDTKEYETAELDGLPMYKISDVPLDTAEFHRAMVIFPDEYVVYTYGGLDLTVIDMTDEGIPGCVMASGLGKINLLSLATNEVSEMFGASKGVWACFASEADSFPIAACYFIFHKK